MTPPKKHDAKPELTPEQEKELAVGKVTINFFSWVGKGLGNTWSSIWKDKKTLVILLALTGYTGYNKIDRGNQTAAIVTSVVDSSKSEKGHWRDTVMSILKSNSSKLDFLGIKTDTLQARQNRVLTRLGTIECVVSRIPGVAPRERLRRQLLGDTTKLHDTFGLTGWRDRTETVQ